MGLDVIIGPPAGFLEWSDEQWDEYFEDEEEGEGDKLGSYGAVVCTVNTVSMNLESGEPGSRFPMFMRIANDEGGWYLSDLSQLLAEIRTIRDELRELPLERVAPADYGKSPQAHRTRTPQEIQELRADFESSFPDRPLRNIADFNHHLLDTLERLAATAAASDKGLIIC